MGNMFWGVKKNKIGTHAFTILSLPQIRSVSELSFPFSKTIPNGFGSI